MAMKYIIGLTGLMGSGKSAVATEFARLGIDIIDTDVISHQITAPDGIAISSIIEEFGSEFITADGALNRAFMRELICSNIAHKFRLENILHPLILRECRAQIKISKSPYVIVVIPLLFKSLYSMSLIQRSIFVDCNKDILITRIIKRDNLNPEQINTILNYQTPAKLQLQLCDDIIDNNITLEKLYNSVRDLDKKYREFIVA